MEHISHCYEDRWVLKDHRFSVGAGEAVAVLGPNGSGKTTLLKILATLVNPTRGEGKIFDLDLKTEALKIRRNLHWLGHENSLYAALSAAENLKFFCRLQGVAPDLSHIQEVLAEVGLAAVSDHRVGTFSAGMKKRLALARLMLKKVSLILLDEPHTNLDKNGRELMDRFILRWKKSGVTLLLASHEEETLRPLCDSRLVLSEGRIISQGGKG